MREVIIQRTFSGGLGHGFESETWDMMSTREVLQRIIDDKVKVFLYRSDDTPSETVRVVARHFGVPVLTLQDWNAIHR